MNQRAVQFWVGVMVVSTGLIASILVLLLGNKPAIFQPADTDGVRTGAKDGSKAPLALSQRLHCLLALFDILNHGPENIHVQCGREKHNQDKGIDKGDQPW